MKSLIITFQAKLQKKRWKSLRDNYRTELKKVKIKPKSGSGALPTKYTKWVLFDAMDFLRDVMATGPQEGNLTETNRDSEITESDLLESDKTTNTEAEDSILEIKTSNSPKKRKGKKRTIDPSENIFIEIEKQKLKILENDRELKNDGDYNFLISFLPHMKDMSN